MLVLDHVKQEEQISFLTNAFQKAATREAKTTVNFEKNINKFLDDINERKSYLRRTIENLTPVLPTLSKNSWFIDPSEELLAAIKHIIQLMNELAASMIRIYAQFNQFFVKKGIDRTDLREYKEFADRLKELATDLNDRFFVLPEDNEFNDLMSQISDL